MRRAIYTRWSRVRAVFHRWKQSRWQRPDVVTGPDTFDNILTGDGDFLVTGDGFRIGFPA